MIVDISSAYDLQWPWIYIVLNQRFVVYRTGRWRQKFSQHDSNPQNYVCFYLKGRLHVHIPLCYTKARSLHLACLNTPPTARGLATIGCWLSCHMILTFTSLAESSRTIVTSSKHELHDKYETLFIYRNNYSWNTTKFFFNIHRIHVYGKLYK